MRRFGFRAQDANANACLRDMSVYIFISIVPPVLSMRTNVYSFIGLVGVDGG